MKQKLLFLLFLFPVLVQAQYEVLSDFSDTVAFNGSSPEKDQNLIVVGGFLYGMTNKGGVQNKGVIFKIKPDGTEYMKLFEFKEAENGVLPVGSLISDGTFLYGTTSYGGTNNYGTIFKIRFDGTDHTKLFDFVMEDGMHPSGSLAFDGTFLYGMTQGGGARHQGVVFKIKPDGTGYKKLLDFDEIATGKWPEGALLFDGTFLYGTASTGGAYDVGVIFKIKPDGSGYAKLFDFQPAYGVNPLGTLISDGTFLYGMTNKGGATNSGVAFRIKPDGTEFSKLVEFIGISNGAFPFGSLVSDGTYIYGTTQKGGTNEFGVIFKLKPDGSDYSLLFNFLNDSNGGLPLGSLTLHADSFYGMTNSGGTTNVGVVYKIKPDGTEYTKLLQFINAGYGKNPWGSLISDGTYLYGMTKSGGNHNSGVIFKIKPNGTAYTKLFDFSDDSGLAPEGALVYDGTFLYGMTRYGGSHLNGVIFKIKPDGTEYTKLLDLKTIEYGERPQGSLLLYDNFLYGTTQIGGIDNEGLVFKIKTDGTNYEKLLDFATENGRYPTGSLITDGTFLYGTTTVSDSNNDLSGTIFKIKFNGAQYSELLLSNADQGGQFKSLVADETFLYGMTYNNGTEGSGSVFKIKKDGTAYTKLHSFGYSIGNFPWGSLIKEGDFLYGMTKEGGSSGQGVIFKIMSNGSSYIRLFNFGSVEGSGGRPYGDLFFDGISLYGMTSEGGTTNSGTIFKYELFPTVVSEISTKFNFNLYPNPTSKTFQLKLTNTSSAKSNLEVYSVVGEKIYSSSINSDEESISLDVPNGIYFVKIKTDKSETTKKLVIQK